MEWIIPALNSRLQSDMTRLLSATGVQGAHVHAPVHSAGLHCLLVAAILFSTAKRACVSSQTMAHQGVFQYKILHSPDRMAAQTLVNWSKSCPSACQRFRDFVTRTKHSVAACHGCQSSSRGNISLWSGGFAGCRHSFWHIF